MPLQNRVNPFGQLEAVSARGEWLGNRGVLHNERREIVALWRSKAWITCRLQFHGVHREVFSPRTWSELFFLDEATAFAAGHRPCAYCRRGRYEEFKRGWCSANLRTADARSTHATDIDARLHAERVTRDGRKVTFRERFGRLPAGTFIAYGGTPCLLWRRELFPWSHAGYQSPLRPPDGRARVDVLTPASIVALFRAGFTPHVHESAFD